MASAISGISAVSNINRAVAQIGNANQTSNVQTMRQLDSVTSKIDGTAQKVVDAAVDMKSIATQAKGNAIDMLA